MTNTPDFIEKQPEKHLKVDFKKNPFEKYQNKFSTSLSTLFMGLILFVIGFVLLGYSEGSLKESNTVQGLPLLEAETLTRHKGLVKIIGFPEASCQLNIPACEENLIYFKKIREEFIDGKYVQVRQDESWTNFKLGNVIIQPANAIPVLNLQEKSRVESEETINNETVKYREIITGIADSEKLIVVGELINNEIKSGSLFIVSNKTNKQIISDLKEGKMTNWWIFKLSALLLLTLGIGAFVLPIIVFLDIFPEFGWILTTLVFLISAIVSFIFVFLSTVVLTYWWLIFVLVGFVLIMLVRIKSKSTKKPLNFIP
ncbi:hypothetical protein JW911_04175 [Candidatus Peregrinibacteria bacterium]|nr:hypothetical protein [Candidatus Peregrinibacteria bacterium]